MSKESSDIEPKPARSSRALEPSPKATEPVLVDYQGTGGWSCMCGSKYLVLTPGLNVVDSEEWASVKSTDKQVKPLASDIAALEPDTLSDLVSRTQSKVALQHMQQHLPGALVRRVAGLANLIERKLRTAR